MSRDVKYIGMDVHKEAIVIAVRNASGQVVMESIVETKASSILQFIHGLRGELHVTWEEGTWAAWLYDLLKPQVHEVLVCNPRRNALLKEGSKNGQSRCAQAGRLVAYGDVAAGLSRRADARAKWRALRSARFSTLKKDLTPPTPASLLWQTDFADQFGVTRIGTQRVEEEVGSERIQPVVFLVRDIQPLEGMLIVARIGVYLRDQVR
jgi:hypothetical protein